MTYQSFTLHLTAHGDYGFFPTPPASPVLTIVAPSAMHIHLVTVEGGIPAIMVEDFIFTGADIMAIYNNACAAGQQPELIQGVSIYAANDTTAVRSDRSAAVRQGVDTTPGQAVESEPTKHRPNGSR